MIRQNKYKIIISIIITLLPLVFGLFMWDRLPGKMATNFGWNGSVTGYSSKLFAVVGLPAILTGINLICIFATSADPRKENIGNSAVSVALSIVPACSLLCGICIYGNALGYKVRVENIMPAFMGVLCLVIGFLLPGCKQNYSFGIKLPWTLHDEENWNKTHAFAGKLWVVGGVLMVIAGLLNFTSVFLIIIFAIILIPTGYSYSLYKKNTDNL